MFRPSFCRCLPVLNCTLSAPQCAAAIDRCTPVVYSSLPNGCRVATEYLPNCQFATVGVWIDAGSRFEDINNNGVAHFLEHMNFKGTAKYSKRAVEDLFEHRGAHFNAYTSRDRTAYYVKAFKYDVEKMIDVVSDLLQNGRYDPSDVELERPTILAEMREVEELVDEVLMDNLHQAAYDPAHCGLPLTILGPVENISSRINRDMIQEFVRVHYTGPRMSFISSGGIHPDEAHRLAEKFFGNLPAANNSPLLQSQYRGGYTVMWNEQMATANTAFAYPICGAIHDDSYALQLVHNVIGQVREGQHDQFAHQRLNPRLPWEKLSNLVQLRPFYTPYKETSLLGYQLVTMRTAVADANGGVQRDESQTVLLDHMLKLFNELSTKAVDAALLEEAKSEYKSSVMMMRDSTTNSAEDLGRQMIHLGRRVPLREVFERVDAVTPAVFRDTLAKYVQAVQPTVSYIGSASAVPRFDALTQVKHIL
ncbi:metallo-peptidase, Clan ME, Family M16 [Trypanosoma brucei gambiense DAL972]|uniref:Metallo-peptidase, Clan ME, Family M16 n=2 Tax=Trypanosoma brucei TaxID=5691 RepID=C9ZXM0_TRYB9|nr:metallo-peptidase, Clan ME, Family M16 [Trypanosoma brucei gambiense DAL972]RHW70362.1 metallo-peptidase [Trypanosoma brucei equiperdum]CBH14164.1 metallo-peptidase, Clan ME, Family M16 [Trypanosoma brucei gambiense DAL972]|eukprot:XP_011776435.1 metallo-peptidase, Clan ME, Family M16 [Trypanosoma brucei gambiense DAL972]